MSVLPSLPVSPVAKAAHSALPWYLAAGLVGADIGTSIFYSTGALFPHVGFAAPFFILAVCFCMWLFKTTYQEGCSVSPLNGGAYTMVLQTIGRRAALVVGSLTVLSYLATAAVSALSGALYLSTLWEGGWPLWLVAMVASVPVVTFALLNLFGLKESTKIVFGIAAFHFGMLIAMDIWGLTLAFTQEVHWERLFTSFGHLGPAAIVLGFAGAFLGITGFESAAQIIEEIEAPSHESIRKIYLTIVALVSFTSPITSMLCLVLLSDADIVKYQDAFLSGLALHEGGNLWRTLLVMNACLTLFAAVNTAFAGATGLMTTMGKQGNLPAIVLRQWLDKSAAFKGYPFVAMPFAALCMMMLVAFPGAVNRLGEVYGMAFLAVMLSYCIGVVLLRVHQPTKVSRAPWVSKWTLLWKGKALPIAPMISACLLAFAAITLIVTAREARDLGIQLFLAVLLVMVYYRLGQVEQRLVRLPDLRLGLGKYRGLESMPTLPTYILCATGADGARLVTMISYILRKYGENCEIIVFHAEDQNAPHGVTSEGLERLISQHLEGFYEGRDLILGVKVLPGNLLEVLPEYVKTRPFDKVFITTGHDPKASETLRNLLNSEIGIDVERLDEQDLPKGPGVWFTQWSQGLRRRERNWSPEDSVFDEEAAPPEH